MNQRRIASDFRKQLAADLEIQAVENPLDRIHNAGVSLNREPDLPLELAPDGDPVFIVLAAGSGEPRIIWR